MDHAVTTRLKEVVAGLDGDFSVARSVELDSVVVDVQQDSRPVTPGAVFVATGRTTEGLARHLAQAREAGPAR